MPGSRYAHQSRTLHGHRPVRQRGRRHPGSSTAVGVRPQPSWPAGAIKRKSRRYPRPLSASLPVLRLTVKTSRVASRSFRPRLKGIELAADGGSYRQDGGAYCRPDPPGTAFRRGRPRGSRPPPDAQSL